jgi:hypothetical protein
MELPSVKVMTAALVMIAGAAVVIVSELQAEGIELPSIVISATTVLSALASYLVRETRPSPSARATINSQ